MFLCGAESVCVKRHGVKLCVCIHITTEGLSTQRRASLYTFFIVLAFRPHGSGVLGDWNRYFLKPGPKVDKSENDTLASSCVRPIRIFCETMMSSHHVSAASHVTATTIMADYMIVFVLLQSLLALLQQNLLLLCNCYEQQAIMDNTILVRIQREGYAHAQSLLLRV